MAADLAEGGDGRQAEIQPAPPTRRLPIYVGVMLFEGFSLHATGAPNTVNGIGITSIDDYQVLPNVLYEVANESVGRGSVDREFAQQLGLGRLEPVAVLG